MYLDLPIFNFLVLKFFSSNYRLKQIKENKKKTNKQAFSFNYFSSSYFFSL